MSQIVILTPTYNRADKLPKLYNSLKSQEIKEFLWLIIDDGSKDNTNELVDKMIKENEVNIKYVYQPNGGKARALNNGFNHKSDARVFVVVDSDDYLLPSAVGTIQKYINEYESNKEVGAFFFYYKTAEGNILKPSGRLISNDKIMTRYEYNNMYKQNDGCICYLNRAIKKYKYPEFDGERYLGPTILQMQMAEEYKIVFSPRVIGVADYLEGGLTQSGRSLRLKNPMGMFYYSKLMMDRKSKFKTQLKYSISIWPYAKLTNQSYFNVISNVKRPLLLSITYIPGILLFYYWKKNS